MPKNSWILAGPSAESGMNHDGCAGAPSKKSGWKTRYSGEEEERMSAPWRDCAENPKMSPMMRMAVLASLGPVMSRVGG